MRPFPKGTSRVNPLYRGVTRPTQQSNHQQLQQSNHQGAGRGKSAAHNSSVFKYFSTLQVIGSKMYEPVSDQCVTTIIKPKFANRISLGEDTTTVAALGERKFSIPNDLVPPEKPPRRHKRNLSCQEDYKMRTAMGGEATINIDHINLESAQNYKNKLLDASVQTSPLIPYRLRFWPKSTLAYKCEPGNKGCSAVKISCCCRIVSQWVLSQVGLTLVVILWALLGALAFYNTEGPRELAQSDELAKLQNEQSIELATTLRQTIEHPESWHQTIQNYMATHEKLLLEAVSAGYGEGGGGNIWTYPGCILFAVSLLTTLGFGAPVPRTPLGRGAAVLFSAIGIPLHFLLILNMGNLGAIKLQQFALRNIESEIPAQAHPKWLKWFPFASIFIYYIMGVILFGFVRQRDPVDCFMFPLDFTAAGGVAKTYGHVRILYALYLEVAVTLAALVVSLIQASATRGIVDIGLKLGLLTNT